MNRIAELRKQHNLTQTQLANMIGIKANTVSQYESGLRKPILRNVKAMAELFHVTPEYLLGLSEANPPPDKADNSLCQNDRVRRIKEISGDDAVNLYLSLGWQIINTGIIDGKFSYILGWCSSSNPPDPENEANVSDKNEPIDLNDPDDIAEFIGGGFWEEKDN